MHRRGIDGDDQVVDLRRPHLRRGGHAVLSVPNLASLHNRVLLSYRGKQFSRVKAKNRQDLDGAVAQQRVLLGEEAYAHLHWDTIATNGRVLLCLRRHKHERAVEKRRDFSVPADWFWCFDQIEKDEDVRLALPAEVLQVPEELRASLKILPDLEWLAIRRVNYISHGARGPVAKHRPAPDGIRFFRFAGGLGLSIAENKS